MKWRWRVQILVGPSSSGSVNEIRVNEVRW